MKGWILVENNKPVVCSNGSVEVFKTKNELFDNYCGALGDMNAVKKIELILTEDYNIFKYKKTKANLSEVNDEK